jgi:hypothetical protein
MADHRAIWVRLRAVARQRYPDDDMAAKAAARALFDKEEAASYAADLDARAEEKDVLDTARATTRLRGELREELWAEGSGAGDTEEEYVHLVNADQDNNIDADDLAYLELPTDEEAACNRCGKHASILAWRKATMGAPAILARAATVVPARADPALSRSS